MLPAIPLIRHWLLHGFALAIAVLHLAFVPLVLSRRSEPSVTIAWLLCLLLLPAVGVVLYWIFGRGEVRRSARARRALLKERQSVEPEPDYACVAAHLRPLARAAWEAGRTALTVGNRVELLIDAAQTYPAKLDAIHRAKRSVTCAYYVFRHDATGRTFRAALEAAARRGVEVRVLLDAFGAPNQGAFWSDLRKAGGRVVRFLPVNPFEGWSLNLRNHRKILVVDGEVGFVGGLNIGDEYYGTPALGAWRDVHLKLQGPAVRPLAAVFADDWAFATGEAIPLPEAAAPDPSGSAVQILPSGPDDRALAIYRATFAALSTAERFVDVTTPYYIPNRPMAEALESAALRGVRVRLLLPARNNQRLTALASRSYWDELLEAGVEIHRYLPGMIHAKCVVIDRAWGSVGTANLDVRSFKLNFEVNALLYGSAEVGKLADAVELDFQKSERVDTAAFRARPWWNKSLEGGARLLSPIL